MFEEWDGYNTPDLTKYDPTKYDPKYIADTRRRYSRRKTIRSGVKRTLTGEAPDYWGWTRKFLE